MYEITIQLPFNGFYVKGILSLPVRATSLIIFSQDFRSSRLYSYTQQLARRFQQKGFGTLRLELTDQNNQLPEDYLNVDLLSRGLVTSTKWLHQHSEYRSMDLAYFGSGIGAAVALTAAGKLGNVIKTVVSLSGSFELSELQLSQVVCPVLLMVGGLDPEGIISNKKVKKYLATESKLTEILEASHLFKESGTLSKAANNASHWFIKYLNHIPQPALVSP